MDFVERIFHISPDGSPLPLITKIEPCASGEKKPRLLAAFATVLTTGAVAPTMSSPNTIRRGSASPLSGWDHRLRRRRYCSYGPKIGSV
jgi:hypothetical protein